jgi:flagellar biosynthesis/type III secretory pathway protein FliH
MPLAFASIARAIGIKGFIAIGMALALAIVMWRADRISAARDHAIERVYAEQAAHAVTLASNATLKAAIAKANAEAQARADALTAARKEAAASDLRLAEARVASDSQIARLRALGAATGAQEACPVPEALAGALEGL